MMLCCLFEFKLIHNDGFDRWTSNYSPNPTHALNKLTYPQHYILSFHTFWEIEFALTPALLYVRVDFVKYYSVSVKIWYFYEILKLKG